LEDQDWDPVSFTRWLATALPHGSVVNSQEHGDYFSDGIAALIALRQLTIF